MSDDPRVRVIPTDLVPVVTQAILNLALSDEINTVQALRVSLSRVDRISEQVNADFDRWLASRNDVDDD